MAASPDPFLPPWKDPVDDRRAVLLADASRHAARALVDLDAYRKSDLPELRDAYAQVHELLTVLAGLNLLMQLPAPDEGS